MKKQESWASRRRSASPGTETGAAVDSNEAALECSLDELREFLEADLLDVKVDPDFKERLRSRLWEMVQFRNRTRAVHVRRS